MLSGDFKTALTRTIPNVFRRMSRSHLRKIIYAIVLSQVLLVTVLWSSSKRRTTVRPLTDAEKMELAHQAELNPHLVDPDYDYFRMADSDESREEYSGSSSSSSSTSTMGAFADYLTGWYSASTEAITVETLSKLYEKLKYNTKPFWFDDYTLQNNLLNIAYGPEKDNKWAHIEDIEYYDSDPRLIWTVYMNHLLKTGQEGESNSYRLPFSWYDWTDMHELNKLVALKESRPKCDFLFEGAFQKELLAEVENELQNTLFTKGRSKYDNEKWYIYARQYGDDNVLGKLNEHCEYLIEKPKFSTGMIVKKRSDRCRLEVYTLQIRNYLLTSIPAPLSLTVTASSGETYQFYFQQEGEHKNMVQSGLLKEYIEDKSGHIDPLSEETLLDKEDITFNHFEKFGEFVEHSEISSKFILDIKETNHNLMTVDELVLNEEDFEFDPEAKIKELEEIPVEQRSPHTQKYLESLKTSITYNPALCPKYFQECGGIQEYRGMGYHRDGRFFNGDSFFYDKQEYSNRLNSMIRTFQKFTLQNGIISWLSHGTLYGYMYNGEAFPWDEDFDLQLPIKHLNYLAQYFNQSIVLEDPREGNGRYLVDVGSSITVRTNGNGKNNIDARFIDLDSGLYIDLTGLSVSSAVAKDKVNDYMTEQAKALNIDVENPTFEYPSDLVPNDADHIGFMNIYQLNEYRKTHEKEFNGDDTKMIEKLFKGEEEDLKKSKSFEKKLNPAQRYHFHKTIKMYNCRNNHMSPISYLSPMYNTFFHGIPALIPKRYVRSLRNEYGVPDQYGHINYKEYTFLPSVMHWIDTHFVEKCSNLKNWYRDTVKLPKTSAIKEMEFSDVQTFLANIPEMKTDEMATFAHLYNSFDQFAYRMKEIAIEFHKDLSQAQKEELLKILRTECSSKIKQPGKDAYLYEYERRLFNKLKEQFDPAIVEKTKASVDAKYLNLYWDQLSALKSRTLPLFHTNLENTLDFNSGPDLNDSNYIDMNYQGRSDIYPDNSRDCLKLFDKDPM